MTSSKYKEFQDIVWDYYKTNGRELPWRKTNKGRIDPYHILVSEFMLQQTQVNRVIPKYQQFIATFPDLKSLANAQLGDVLSLWSGLGYNRRAKYLHDAAKQLALKKDFPKSIEELSILQGIGRNTAAAIIVYSFNSREVFIETNIRTVYLHHFFKDKNSVSDNEILRFVEKTLPAKNIRQWYWALMDYGTYLKSTGVKNIKSKHYVKQTKFEGSDRQIRGKIIAYLTQTKKPENIADLHELINDKRSVSILESLKNEGLVKVESGNVSLP